MVNDYSDSFITEAILATILEKRIERRKKSMHQKILLYRDYIKPSIPHDVPKHKTAVKFC